MQVLVKQTTNPATRGVNKRCDHSWHVRTKGVGDDVAEHKLHQGDENVHRRKRGGLSSQHKFHQRSMTRANAGSETLWSNKQRSQQQEVGPGVRTKGVVHNTNCTKAMKTRQRRERGGLCSQHKLHQSYDTRKCRKRRFGRTNNKANNKRCDTHVHKELGMMSQNCTKRRRRDGVCSQHKLHPSDEMRKRRQRGGLSQHKSHQRDETRK